MASIPIRSVRQRRLFQLRLFLDGILTGILAGLSVALYRFLIEEAEAARGALYASHLVPSLLAGDILPLIFWFLFLALAAALLSWMCRFEPMASGSGIPQVKGVLLGRFAMRWARVLSVQIFGGALAIGAGLSLGHAGPAVQIGAASAEGFCALSRLRRIEARYLFAGGAGAGLSAVFNAPLSGLLFILEILPHNLSAALLLPAMAAASSAALVIRFFFGDGTIFHFTNMLPLPAGHILYAAGIAAVAGAAAVPFNSGLIRVRRLYQLPFLNHPYRRIACPLFLAGILGFVMPPILGGGEGLVNALLSGQPDFSTLLFLLAAKAAFTLLSFGSGVPGGFFFPSLVIGAMTGAATGSLLISAGAFPPEYMTNCIILSMAAFFAGSVRAPITGAALLLEMTGDFQHLLFLTMAAAIGYTVSGLLGSAPIYDALLQRLPRRK